MIATTLALTGWLTLLCQADPELPAPLPKLQRIDFSADHPETWPRTNPPLEAVPRDEFDRLWSAAQPVRAAQPAVVLERAVYQASLVNDRLQGGTFSAEVLRTSPAAAWLKWSPFNLALGDLRWSDGPAVFGADAQGQHWLLADRPRRELTGVWTRLGRRIGRQTEFQIEVPEAISTTLVLKLPRDLELRCPDATIPLESGPLTGAWATWRVDLGSRTRLTLVARSVEDGAPLAPVVTYRKQLSAELGEDHLRFQIGFTAEVLNAPVTELEFTLPKAVELYSVNYGTDTLLRWTRVSDDGNRLRIRVTLPDALQGPLRPLRLEGLLPRRSNVTVVIPQVELADAAFLSGRHTVTLLRPLQLTSMRMTGCREAAAVTPTNEGDTYQFQQFLPDALLTMEVRRPTSQLNVLTLSAVTFREEEWQQRTDLLWSALNGSAFQVGIQIPSDWEITDVDAFTTAGSPDPVNWDLHDDTDGRKLLHVEFLEAITPTAPRTVRLLMRQRRSTATRTVAFPAPRPLDVAASESVLVLQGEGMYRIGLPPGPAMTPVTPAALPESWQALPLWATLMRDEERHPAVWTRVDGSDLSMTTMALEREPQPAEVVASVEATQRDESFAEQFDLVVTPEDPRLFDRMLVYLSEAGGETSWQVINPADQRLEASRLPADQHALWKLPTTGELWEIRLPEGAVTEWRLRGQRRRAASSPLRMGLVHVPQAARFQGHVVVRQAASSPLMTWNARGLREVENTVDDGAAVRRWEYSRLTADLSGGTTSPSEHAARAMADGQLTSTLSPVATADEIHQLRFNLRGVTRPFSLMLPDDAEWILAKINGETIFVEDGRELHIAAVNSDEQQVIEWVYRSKPQLTHGGTRRRIPWPSGWPETAWTRFEWTLQGPPQTHLDAACSGLRSVDPVPVVHWRQRLFGPLARSESAPLFLPWQRDGWRAWIGPTTSVTGQSLKTDAGITRRFLGPTPPEEFVVDVVDLGQIRILAWSILISGALLLLILRAMDWKWRDRFVVAMVTGCCALSFFWAQPWVDVSGGAIVGMVIGALLPRGWWKPPVAVRAPVEHVPGGSTKSFVFPQSATLVLLCAFCGTIALAAEVAPGGRGAVMVYVPVDADGKPSQRLPFVYLSANALKQLRAMAPPQETVDPSMLIERADYRVTIGPESRASFSVSYRILTPRHEAILCDLPLPSVTLTGPQSCLLDGQPATVSALPGKRGLRIVIPAASTAVSAIHATEFTAHDLTLDFDHPWRRQAAGGMCELPLPPTAWTRVEVRGLSATNELTWDGVSGGWERSLDRRQATVDLGAADRFHLSWYDRTTVENQPPVTVRVTTAESLDVSAAAIEVRARSTVAPTAESVSRFAWEFPADTNFQKLEIRPAGRTELTTLKNKTVRVDVEFYGPVHDIAVLEAEFVCRHSPLQGEFTWRGVQAVEPSGIQVERAQRYWSLTSVPEIRVLPQSVENSGLVPVVADSVRDLFTGLTGSQLSQSLFQVGTDSPVAFRWSSVAPKRRLLLWQQRGEIVGTRLNWSVEADLDCTASPPAYSHTLLVDRRLQIDQISVRERGAERLLRWTELRPSGSPQARVTLWLTDPVLETQRITLSAHMPLSASGSLTMPNVRCEDAELVGGRWELQSVRELRGTWLSLRGLKSLSSTDDRLDASQHWIFEQSDTEPRAVLRLSPRGQTSSGRALYLLSAADGGRVQLRTRWEMPSSDSLSGMQFLLPPPWKLAQSPVVTGATQESVQESERGTVMTIAVQPGPVPVTVELVLQALRSDFAHRHMIFPQLSLDPGMISWVGEAVPADGTPILEGLDASHSAEWPEWLAMELARSTDGSVPRWRTALSQELPQEWPLTKSAGQPAEPPLDWLEHRIWCEVTPRIVATSRAWLERPIGSLTLVVPPKCDLDGAEVDGRLATLAPVRAGTWELAAENGDLFREVKLYWRRSLDTPTWPTSWTIETPLFNARPKSSVAVTIFPPPGRTFLQRKLGSEQAWIDRGLQRLEVLGDHLAFHNDVADGPAVALHFQQLYETTAEKLSRHVDAVMRPGSTRAERWAATVFRMNQVAPLLADQGTLQASSELDDRLLDHADADYRTAITDGQVTADWLVPSSILPATAALFVLLVGYPLLSRLVRGKELAWFRAHPHLSLTVVGVAAWLCLTPSLAGFALAAAALLSGVMSYRSAPAEV